MLKNKQLGQRQFIITFWLCLLLLHFLFHSFPFLLPFRYWHQLFFVKNVRYLQNTLSLHLATVHTLAHTSGLRVRLWPSRALIYRVRQIYRSPVCCVCVCVNKFCPFLFRLKISNRATVEAEANCASKGNATLSLGWRVLNGAMGNNRPDIGAQTEREYSGIKQRRGKICLCRVKYNI